MDIETVFGLLQAGESLTISTTLDNLCLTVDKRTLPPQNEVYRMQRFISPIELEKANIVSGDIIDFHIADMLTTIRRKV